MSNFFQLWLNVAFETSEMMFASAQVIGHRTSRMTLAGPLPNARDQQEFHLMKQEKIEAAAESMYAMAEPMISLNRQISVLAFSHSMTAATNLFLLATSLTPQQSNRRQIKLVNDAIGDSLTAGKRLSDSTAKVAQQGLKPISSRAKANAKRLGRT